jgi:hypothetical protein
MVRLELMEAAYQVVARHRVHGSELNQRLDLWHALGGVVRAPDCAHRFGEEPAEDRTQPDILIAQATHAAYLVALRHGFPGSFLDLELDLWRTLEQTMHQSRFGQKLFPPSGTGPCG